MTTFDTDPNSQTVAAAWASSPLGQAEGEVSDGFATTGPTEQVAASEEEATAKRVMVAAGLACGVAAGALLGVMFFANTDPAQPAVVVVPGSDAGLSAPETAGSTSSSRLPGPPRALPGAPLPAPEGAAAPNPIVRVPERVVVPPAGGGRADVGSPRISAPGDTTVIVDIPVPVPPPVPPLPPDPPDPPDPLTPPDLPLAPVLPDLPIPPLWPEPAPEALAPLPAPAVELPVTPRIVDPPLEAEPPSSEPSFGPRITDPDWDVSELLGP